MTTITLCIFPEKRQTWKGSRKAHGQMEDKTFWFLASQESSRGDCPHSRGPEE